MNDAATTAPRPHPRRCRRRRPRPTPARPKLAVWKFASCDGCQLSILNCEDELLSIAEAVHIAYFPEATRAVVEGPYELSLVEGSITTPEDIKRIHEIRAQSGTLVTIGACATAGGIQALRNWADVDEYRSIVYAHPEYLSTLDTSTRHREPRGRRLRAARLPRGQGPTGGGARRVPRRPQAPHPHVFGVRRMQAQGQRVRARSPPASRASAP